MRKAYSEELLDTLEIIFFDEEHEFEEIEEAFFSAAYEGGMTEEEAVGYWNELSF
jgi:hypothetical protein